MVQELLTADHVVTAFVRRENLLGYGSDLASSEMPTGDKVASTATVDVVDRPRLAEALASVRPEAVVHLAAQADPGASWQRPTETYVVNIVGTSQLLEVARNYASRVLLVGSALQYRRRADGKPLREDDELAPDNPYALSKSVQEQIGRLNFARHGSPVVSTRSFNHTGPGQRAQYAVGSFAEQLASIQRGESTGPLKVGNLSALRDFLDVRDVVRAYRLLLESGIPGEVYNVCSGSATSLGSILDTLMRLAGMEGVDVQERRGEGTRDVLVGDPSKIRDEVGWRPSIPLVRSLADTLISYGAECRSPDEVSRGLGS